MTDQLTISEAAETLEGDALVEFLATYDYRPLEPAKPGEEWDAAIDRDLDGTLAEVQTLTSAGLIPLDVYSQVLNRLKE